AHPTSHPLPTRRPSDLELLQGHGIRVAIRDERYAGKPIEVTFQGNLRDDQAEAIRQTLRHDEGVLCAPTAFGKTVVAARLIADRSEEHTSELQSRVDLV